MSGRGYLECLSSSSSGSQNFVFSNIQTSGLYQKTQEDTTIKLDYCAKASLVLPYCIFL